MRKMNASLAVARLSTPPAISRRWKRGIRTRPSALRSDGARAGSPASPAGGRGCTNVVRTAKPRTARKNETRKIEWNASGAAASMQNASSGPSMAPVVSIARCTPNAAPSSSFGVDSEIIASRGAVRIPLPARSSSTTAPIADTAVPTTISRSLQTAEIP